MRFKQKKNVRMRGSKTHGWGAKKKHRGAGHRGGRGMAGTGKRADSKKPSIWTDHSYFGKHGFTSRKSKILALNLQYIEENAIRLENEGLIKKEGDHYTLNMRDLGCEKLISKGRVTRKYHITCAVATEQAIEKIKKAGGDVIISA